MLNFFKKIFSKNDPTLESRIIALETEKEIIIKYSNYLKEKLEPIVHNYNLFPNIIDNAFKNMNNPIAFYKCRNVASPNRGTKDSSGIDFFVPNDYITKDNGVFNQELNEYVLEVLPNASVMIPSGIHVKLPSRDWSLIAFNKSGIASKKNLLSGACVTSDTIIETNKGNFCVHELTKEFVKNNDILIKSYNIENNEIEFKPFCGFLYNGSKETVELIFENNKKINCSIDHKILTSNRNWVEAQYLTENDDILSF